MSTIIDLPNRRVWALFAIVLCAALYLTNLTAMGVVSVDEPRYAAVGRAMADSGDWITPRLWGSPWFEKPVLLYWLVACGFKAGLGPDLAPRLPIALLSLVFLAFFWTRIRVLWDATVATYSTGILATTIGWLAYSHIAITDVPLAAAFITAVLLSLKPKATRTQVALAAAALGFAVLAKSLIAGILFLPVIVLDSRWRAWLKPAPILMFLAVALPWHVLCTAANGSEFLRVLFLEHQFGRFSSGALQHVQPFWYYIPVFLMLSFPWFPLLAMAPRTLRDPKIRTLWAVFAFGFIFLSVTVNKLPHYVLPLLPVASILMGLGLARAKRGWLAVIAPVAFMGIFPMAAAVAPTAVAHGLGRAAIPWTQATWLIGTLLLGIAIAKLRRFSVAAGIAVVGVSLLCFEYAVFPKVDSAASMRSLWRSQHPGCAPPSGRAAIYGLSYYAQKLVPVCPILDQQHDSVVR